MQSALCTTDSALRFPTCPPLQPWCPPRCCIGVAHVAVCRDSVRALFVVSFEPMFGSPLTPTTHQQTLERAAESDSTLDQYEIEGPDRAELLQDLGEFQLATVRGAVVKPAGVVHAAQQVLYNAMQENNCSEFSSRMSAMENSTKNATEMLGKLALTYNRCVAVVGWCLCAYTTHSVVHTQRSPGHHYDRAYRDHFGCCCTGRLVCVVCRNVANCKALCRPAAFPIPQPPHHLQSLFTTVFCCLARLYCRRAV